MRKLENGKRLREKVTKPPSTHLRSGVAASSHSAKRMRLRREGETVFGGLVDLALTFLCFYWLVTKSKRRRKRNKDRERRLEPVTPGMVTDNGYVFLPLEGKYEHRAIASWALGRELGPTEVIHHINGIKTDNQRRNLCVLEQAAHDDFHTWLRRKKAHDGHYPDYNYQKMVLRERYAALIFD